MCSRLTSRKPCANGGSQPLRAADRARFRSGPPATQQAVAAGHAERRVRQQRLPRPDPLGLVRTPQRGVGVPQDRRPLVQEVLEDIAAAVPAGVVEPACPAQVPTLLRSSQVVPAVVLVQGSAAHDPQVTPGHEAAVVEHLVLRFTATSQTAARRPYPVNAPDDGRTRCQAASGGPSSPAGT